MRLLFIGGPLDGERKEVPDDKNIVHAPEMVKASHVTIVEIPFTINTSFVAATYIRRPIKYVYVMALQELSISQVEERLAEHLLKEWIKQEHLIQTLSAEKFKQWFESQTLEEAFSKKWKWTEPPHAHRHILSALNTLVPGSAIPRYLQCPHGMCSNTEKSVQSMIIHLNDGHSWTFDQIADYVDSLPFDLTVKENQ